MSIRLTKLKISGYKTLKEFEFEPRQINVLIGRNGAGKSNLISFFRLLNWMLAPRGNLAEFVLRQGGASALLHDGGKTTERINAHLALETDQGENEYKFSLSGAGDDTFIFMDEQFRFNRRAYGTTPPWKMLDPARREAQILELAEAGEPTAKTIVSLIRNCAVHQFHDTSENSRMRGRWSSQDCRLLKEDGANLAPVLWAIQKYDESHYYNIVKYLRQLLPFFADFELDSEHDSMLLKWKEQNTDMVFSASQASDGMLRLMSLITLLLQPEKNIPGIIILDEPELGLHPEAIAAVAGLLKGISETKQIFVATQSAALVDHFDPEDIVVVERDGRESKFERLDSSSLSDWLEDYSLSELWEKNVIGGRA